MGGGSPFISAWSATAGTIIAMNGFDVLVLLATVVAMEMVAWASHKYVMHGFGWGWHASHHRPRIHRFEKNDLFAFVFALVSIVLIWLGSQGAWPLQWIGAGMTGYGLLYFIAHDGLVHRRWPLGVRPRGGYLKRLVQAHRLHHAIETREQGVSYGFLWAPSQQRLAALVREVRARRSEAPGETAAGAAISAVARASQRGETPAPLAQPARPPRHAR